MQGACGIAGDCRTGSDLTRHHATGAIPGSRIALPPIQTFLPIMTDLPHSSPASRFLGLRGWSAA